jgi:hypothetical protein
MASNPIPRKPPILPASSSSATRPTIEIEDDYRSIAPRLNDDFECVVYLESQQLLDDDQMPVDDTGKNSVTPSTRHDKGFHPIQGADVKQFAFH